MPIQWKEFEPDIRAQVGHNLGSFAGNALGGLAVHKIDEMFKKKGLEKDVKAYKALNFNEDEAKALAQISRSHPKLAENMVAHFGATGGKVGGGGAGATKTMTAAANTSQRSAQSASNPSPRTIENVLGALSQNNKNQSPVDYYNQAAMQGISPQSYGQGAPQGNAPGQFATPEQAAILHQQELEQQQRNQIGQPPEGQNDDRMTLGQSLRSPTIAQLQSQQKQDLAERQFMLEQQKFEEQKKAHRYEFTKAEMQEIRKEGKAAKKELKDLSRIQELESEGKLDTPGYVSFLERSGLDIPSLMNEGSQEFQKITANFMSKAREYFGARVTNFEFEQFLKSIPTLSQSPEGRKRVISGLKQIARGKVAYEEALDEVLRENGNMPDYDLSTRITEKIGKKMDKISEKFKKDLDKPVPSGQNRIITALQAAGGSLAGALAPAVPGALIGSAFGPVGAAIGGAAGAGLGTARSLISQLMSRGSGQ